MKYLIRDYSFDYQYSVSFACKSNNFRTAKAKGHLVAFSGTGGLNALTGAFQEVERLRELCKGEYFTDQSATEQNFKRNADRFRIIHLATHAMIDNQNPAKSRLLFNIDPVSGEDGILYSYELYGINLNAGLVTLSACNAGFG